MITDLFSHKIHSSGPEWPEKLAELAYLFSKFDGDIFDRDNIEKELIAVSPRASYASRDRSKFRDEISAYPAYLGLYRLEPSIKGWRFFLTNTAKRFLIKEEPDVGSFMRLQLSLFQYPNGMGASYIPNTNKVRIQANARERTLGFIAKQIHLSPLRLISKSLLVDADQKGIPFHKAFLSFKDIFALANSAKVNQSALPTDAAVSLTLNLIRKGKITIPTHFEKRLHILKHTELFDIKRGGVSFRTPVNKGDEADLFSKIKVICQIQNQFEGFDEAKTGADIEKVIAGGAWGSYFDAAKTLSHDIVSVLAADIVYEFDLPHKEEMAASEEAMVTYPLKERDDSIAAPSPYNRKSELADPEITRIKRQRRNLAHKLLIDKMSVHLKKLGATPQNNPHIDLYAKIPNDGSFIFEMKSGGNNFLEQIRKGVSQLYEYRFRYGKLLKEKPSLCLVIPDDPKNIPWIYEYICVDRDICLCWFDDKDKLITKAVCQKKMEVLATV